MLRVTKMHNDFNVNNNLIYWIVLINLNLKILKWLVIWNGKNIYLPMQQTPNPSAHVPSFDPLILSHSALNINSIHDNS